LSVEGEEGKDEACFFAQEREALDGWGSGCSTGGPHKAKDVSLERESDGEPEGLRFAARELGRWWGNSDFRQGSGLGTCDTFISV